MSMTPLYFSVSGDAAARIAQLQADLGCASPDEAISVALGIASVVSRLIDQDGVLTVIDPAPGLSEEEREVGFDALPSRRTQRRSAA